jgi:hypothetical protein
MLQLDFDQLIGLIGHRYGATDVACPECGPTKFRAYSRNRKVLRVWRDEPNFLTYHCVRCGLSGSARDGGPYRPIDPTKLAKFKAEAEARDLEYSEGQQAKAKWMWSRARLVQGSLAEVYLRSRGISGDLPPTLRFLPPYKPEYHPAMIAAFVIPTEPEPGCLSIVGDSVVGIHLTLLRTDGSGKADIKKNKIMVGPSAGTPIVLAPPNDLLGLTISEGIEDALSLHEATGLGAWAAGSASRLPTLANAIPDYIDCVTIVADDDEAGRNAHKLADLASQRGLAVELIEGRDMEANGAKMGTAA